MARAEVALPTGPSWNPLRCDGTSLPPGWLLAAKLLAFALFPGRRFLPLDPPFLPFFSWLDAPFFASWLAPATAAAFYAAFACLMFNRLVQPACIVIATCLFVHIAGHRLDYANNAMFVGVFLLLVGLYSARTGLWPLRLQLALVYFGASLNKALDPDWWNGQFFDTLMIEALHLRWYEAAANMLPAHVLDTTMGALTIGVEAAIVMGVLWRDGRTGVVLMLGFQVAMLVLTLGQLSTLFLYATLAVIPPFVESPGRVLVLSAWRPLAWWAAALAVRMLPRLLSYA